MRLAGLSENQIGVGIGLYIEVHNQGRVRVGGGVEGIHVVHVVDAAHLLFDGSGNGLLEGLRVRTDVGGQHLNLRRSDVGELSDRQAEDRNRADHYHDDRNHHGDDGSVDEKLGHRLISLALPANGLGFTCIPGRTFCTPSTMTRSPDFSPSATIHWVPTRSPTVIGRMLTLFCPVHHRHLIAAL